MIIKKEEKRQWKKWMNEIRRNKFRGRQEKEENIWTKFYGEQGNGRERSRTGELGKKKIKQGNQRSYFQKCLSSEGLAFYVCKPQNINKA